MTAALHLFAWSLVAGMIAGVVYLALTAAAVPPLY